jgi:hypothetical protein
VGVGAVPYGDGYADHFAGGGVVVASGVLWTARVASSTVTCR